MIIFECLVIYFLFCIIYRPVQTNHLFILKSLSTLKISKHRDNINKSIKKTERRIKFFYFWPFVHLLESYEYFKENRNRIN